jgi:hypothetical protein
MKYLKLKKKQSILKLNIYSSVTSLRKKINLQFSVEVEASKTLDDESTESEGLLSRYIFCLKISSI